MSVYKNAEINKGIAGGIHTAMAGVLNLYGMQQRLDLQKQQRDIQKQNSASYQRMMHYNLASRFEREASDEDLAKWATPSGTGTRAPLSGVDPRARRLGVDASLDVDPRYLQPGADALLD